MLSEKVLGSLKPYADAASGPAWSQRLRIYWRILPHATSTGSYTKQCAIPNSALYQAGSYTKQGAIPSRELDQAASYTKQGAIPSREATCSGEVSRSMV